MVRRSVRLLVLLAAIALTGIAGWRATVNEQHRAALRSEAAASDIKAAETLDALADLRASLYAYVAPGQGYEFWSARAEGLLTSIRSGILELDARATIAGHPLAAQTIDDLDRLTGAELRAREAVKAGQPRFAGDIIFTDMRDRMDGITAQVAGARRTLARTASSADVGITNEQSLLAGAVLAIWLMTGILLMPLPPTRAQAPARPAGLRKPEPLDLSLHESPAVESERVAELVAPSAEPAAAVAVPAAVASAPPTLDALARLCSDLGRVSEAAELEGLMKRGADLLGATGLVVWAATPDGEHLTPAIAYGYGAAALGRIGNIPLSDENVTVSAFRNGAAARTSPQDGRPAVAVPILAPAGPVGVVAAEVSRERNLDTVTALAMVMAAQMATLFQPPAAPADASGETADTVNATETTDTADVSEPPPRQAQA
jgi:hypothetical protein